MGDGEHIWAAGEWALMIRNCFVREEGEQLVIGSGVPNRWIPENGAATFGPTLTPWGSVRISLRRRADGVMVSVAAEWRGTAPVLQVRLPGHVPQEVTAPSATTDVVSTSSL